MCVHIVCYSVTVQKNGVKTTKKLDIFTQAVTYGMNPLAKCMYDLPIFSP